MSLIVLPNIHNSTPADFVRLFHQSQLEWFRHLGEETELDFGRWISNPEFPELPEANCLLDAYLPPGMTASRLIAEMNAKTPRWRACSLNPSMPSEFLGEALVGAGWKATPLNIFYRSKKTEPIAADRSDLIIIPARASYRHYRELMQDRAEAALLHLDDSHFDALLALRAGKPVGCIGVLTSGEVGTVREWYVSADHRNRGIGRLLLHRAMEICARSVLRHLMIGLPPDASSAAHLCKAAGFGVIGQWFSYTAPE